MLPRLYPQPMPAIHPLPEYLATGPRKQLYEDVKVSLAVPWMGVVAMAFSHYEHFFEVFWNGIKPLVTQPVFTSQCRVLRDIAEGQARLLGPQSLQPSLRELGYAERELDDIRAVLEVFSDGNFPYLLLATILRVLLEGEEFGGGTAKPVAISSRGNDQSPRPILMEAHHADAATRALYDDIKATLRLPFVNTDYRALARWPSYFSLAWRQLRSRVAQPQYELYCRTVHEAAVRIVGTEFANPGGLTRQALSEAASKDADFAEVLQVVRLFQWLLPGLVLNVAFLREQLTGTANAGTPSTSLRN